jgi:hypothetical protein
VETEENVVSGQMISNSIKKREHLQWTASLWLCYFSLCDEQRWRRRRRARIYVYVGIYMDFLHACAV